MTTELAFIDALRSLATHPGARNFEDDCAVVEFGGETLVLTHDTMTEGVHFLPEQDPADVAWKLVTVNLSDLAAKGAEPVGVLLGYMFGRDDLRFLEGLHEALEHYGAPLLGGDTVSGKAGQTLGLTAIGRATHVPVPSRAGVQAGDTLYVTGAVGGAMLGLERLRANEGGSEAYRRPEALLSEGQALAPLVTAMMDVSDGLLLDASRLAAASNVSVAMDSLDVPIAVPEDRRAEALRWGDDYELLFTAPASAPLPVPATAIGTVIPPSSAPVLLDGYALRDLAPLGFQH
jgi:thiamine-monophosphate kinase